MQGSRMPGKPESDGCLQDPVAVARASYQAYVDKDRSAI